MFLKRLTLQTSKPLSSLFIIHPSRFAVLRRREVGRISVLSPPISALRPYPFTIYYQLSTFFNLEHRTLNSGF